MHHDEPYQWFPAKVFRNGRSQAVRLPAELRFDCPEIFVRKDEKTGDVILSKRKHSWGDVFAFIDSLELSENDIIERDQPPSQTRDLF